MKPIHRFFLLPVLFCTVLPAAAQTLRFDFGAAGAEDGWTAVTAQTLYDDARGYGFEPGPTLADVTRRKGTALTRDFVVSPSAWAKATGASPSRWVTPRARPAPP